MQFSHKLDYQILDLLKEGRCTVKFIQEKVEKPKPYVWSRMQCLLKAGVINKLERGLYEIA